MTPRRAALALALLLPAVPRAEGYLESPRRLTMLVGIGWEGGMPLMSMRGYVDEPSYRGGRFDARFGIARHLSVGVAASWNWFSQNLASRTVEYSGATVTGPAYDRVQFITVVATAHWYLTDGPVQPYIGAGIGGAWASDYHSVSTLATSESNFGLAADPQAGVLLSIGRGFALDFAARWHYTRTRFAQVKEASWAGVGIGVAAY